MIQHQIKAEAISLRGDPKEEICQAADQKQVDLLVVGSRGLGMLKRYLFIAICFMRYSVVPDIL